MSADRRTLLFSGIAATTAGVAAMAMREASAAPAQPAAEPALDGDLRFDKAARARAADDFGHLVHRAPEGLLLPGSAEDVAATIRWVAGRGRRFAARGRGHSVFGRAMARNGIVGDMSRLRTRSTPSRTTTSRSTPAPPGRRCSPPPCPWAVTPPVLTDYLELSVGGTLAVGGVGGTTSRFWRAGRQRPGDGGGHRHRPGLAARRSNPGAVRRRRAGLGRWPSSPGRP